MIVGKYMPNQLGYAFQRLMLLILYPYQSFQSHTVPAGTKSTYQMENGTHNPIGLYQVSQFISARIDRSPEFFPYKNCSDIFINIGVLKGFFVKFWRLRRTDTWVWVHTGPGMYRTIRQWSCTFYITWKNTCWKILWCSISKGSHDPSGHVALITGWTVSGQPKIRKLGIEFLWNLRETTHKNNQ